MGNAKASNSGTSNRYSCPAFFISMTQRTAINNKNRLRRGCCETHCLCNMKKPNLLLLLLMLMSTIDVSAYDLAVENDDGVTIYYNYTNNMTELAVAKATGLYRASVIHIPSIVNGLSVTAIDNYAFDSCISLQTVTIPNSVISIGNFAFYGCI